MNKEEEFLQKRFLELSRLADQKNITTYTDFLNLNELNILHTTPKNSLFTNFETFGGYAFAERQMASFLPDAFCYESDYPLSCIFIATKNTKYSGPLNHRDYLGSVLGLGIDRSKIGDILVEDQGAFLFVHHDLCQFICDSLTKVKHTLVETKEVDPNSITINPSFQEITGTVSSLRLDSLIALTMKESRSKIIGFIESGKVFVNGKTITTNAYKIKDNDIISIRGYGKFQFSNVLSKTKKDRLFISIKKFV